MGITIKRQGSGIEVLEGAHTLPENEAIELFTLEEMQAMIQNHLAQLEGQIPSFTRGDEDEDAQELFFL